MKILYTLAEIHNEVSTFRAQNKTIGFVPTLGALHEGHMSLIQKSKAKSDVTIGSIFVNPTQFDDKSDFENYPSTIEQDTEMLRQNDCDILFLPSLDEVYPNGQTLEHKYELGRLENILEGATRPGHYQGVAQVVHRLLEMVMPTTIYLGQKDYQQVLIIRKMIKAVGLDVKAEICPIIREVDGLAMSSRNRRLSMEERAVANELYKTIISCKENIGSISIKKLQKWAVENLNETPLISVDYISFRSAKNLKEVKKWDGEEQLILLGAIFLGPIRLIDNLLID